MSYKIIGDYEKKVKEFLLVDNGDRTYTDLITFDTEVDLIELKKVIYEKIKEMPYDYTNEDIYNAIETLGVDFTIKWLGQLEEIEY